MEWGGAMAASLVLVVVLMATLQMPTAYATAKGEMRTVPLGNGATVTLNTDTRIKVYDEEGRRRIRVLRGEVLIEGAGTAVPTLVEVDGKHLEATAATFVVRKLEGRPTQVLVQEGRVVLAGATQSAQIPLPPNTGLSLPEGKERRVESDIALFRANGARAGMAGRKDRPAGRNPGRSRGRLCALQRHAHRYRRPDLAQMQVTGLFAVNNPLGFSRAVAEVFDAEVRQEDGRIIVARAH